MKRRQLYNTIWHCDCRAGLAKLAKNTIDLTVTSPPWDSIFNYQGTKSENHMTWKLFTAVAQELYRVTVPGGFLAWDYADKVKNHICTGSLIRMGNYFLDLGFCLYEDLVIYTAGANIRSSGAARRHGLPAEQVLVFSKGKPNINKIHRREKPNRPESVGKRFQSYQRFTDGSQNVKPTTKIKAVGGRGPVWCYAPQCPNCGEWSGLEYTTNPRFDELSSVKEYYNVGATPAWIKKHPARMSPALVRDLILAYSEWGDIVLDPFAGTATTLEQAYLNQRYYLGMEKTELFYQMCQRRMYEAEQEAMKRLAGM
jgi:site-specific DNA-methyltransferase (adenine-specific)